MSRPELLVITEFDCVFIYLSQLPQKLSGMAVVSRLYKIVIPCVSRIEAFIVKKN